MVVADDGFTREELKQYAKEFIDYYGNTSLVESDARYWWFGHVSDQVRGFKTFFSLAQKNFKKKQKKNKRYDRDSAYDRD